MQWNTKLNTFLKCFKIESLNIKRLIEYKKGLNTFLKFSKIRSQNMSQLIGCKKELSIILLKDRLYTLLNNNKWVNNK